MRYLFASMAVISAPLVAAAAAPRTLKELANMITTYFNAAAGVLIAAVIVWYFWGATSRMFHSSQGAKNEKSDSSGYLWQGIIAIFVLVSVWGIVRLLQTTLFGSAQGGSTNTSSQTTTFNAPTFNE